MWRRKINELVKQLGGELIPAVGFAAGVERLILAMGKVELLESSTDVYFITIGNEANIFASRIANELRDRCKKTVILETLRRSIKSQMREANRCGAKHVIIVGEEEILKKNVIIKDMETSDQSEIPSSDVLNFFNSKS